MTKTTTKRVCDRCGKEYRRARPNLYCVKCILAFRRASRAVARRQNPAPGLHIDGKFREADTFPHTFESGGKQRCGVCGSGDVSMGYGFAGGGGLGGYIFCDNCCTVLDFMEDRSDE